MTENKRLGLPSLGLGLGLRTQHFHYILEQQPEVDWFEAISENFMDSYGRPRHVLRQIAERYPVVLHGVSLSIGSTDPLNETYLARLKQLAQEVQPVWVSDHLCWTGALTVNSHDLLPLPLNEESLQHVAERVARVQDYLGRPLILENPSTYATFQHSTIPEWEFLNTLTERTGCGLLLDVNNVYVSAYNNDFSAEEYIGNIAADRVVQLHLAGHQHCGNYIIDTHDREVTAEVWDLFCAAHARIGDNSVLLEWDGDIPEFPVYHGELLKARQFMAGERLTTVPSSKPTEAVEGVSNPLPQATPELL